MRKLSLVAGFALVAACQAPLAQSAPPVLDGNQMADLCINGGEVGETWCTLYISGFRQGALMEARMQERRAKLCIPESVTNKQFAKTYIKFLREYPEHRHLPASGLVYMTAVTYYSCPKSR